MNATALNARELGEGPAAGIAAYYGINLNTNNLSIMKQVADLVKRLHDQGQNVETQSHVLRSFGVSEDQLPLWQQGDTGDPRTLAVLKRTDDDGREESSMQPRTCVLSAFTLSAAMFLGGTANAADMPKSGTIKTHIGIKINPDSVPVGEKHVLVAATWLRGDIQRCRQWSAPRRRLELRVPVGF